MKLRAWCWIQGCLPSRTIKIQLLAAFTLLAGIPFARAAQKETEKVLLLVARRDMDDPFFKESVVLMLPESQPEIVLGVIVNKPTRIPISKVFPKDKALRDRTVTVYFGGPVDVESPTLIFLSSKQIDRTARVAGNLYFALDPSVIDKILDKPNDIKDERLFLGRSQWAPDQLQDETMEGAWYTEHEDDSWIFNRKAENVWPALIDREDPGSVVELNFDSLLD